MSFKERNESSTERKIIKAADQILNYIVLTILVVLVLFCFYTAWDQKQIAASATSSFTEYKPTADDQISFEELQNMNSDVFGWITVYGTKVDYPLVQGKSNLTYINTDPTGTYALSGSIFLDYRNSRNFDDFNSIIFGHHMAESAMFGDLSNFSDSTYFDSHRYGNLYYSGADHGIDFFAFINADAYDDYIYTPAVAGDTEGQQAYLDYIASTAANYRQIDVQPGDQIVVLSTCSSDATNGRELLIGKVTDEVYSNSYETTPSSFTAATTSWLERMKKFFEQKAGSLRFSIPILMIIPGLVLRIRQNQRL